MYNVLDSNVRFRRVDPLFDLMQTICDMIQILSKSNACNLAKPNWSGHAIFSFEMWQSSKVPKKTNKGKY